MALLGDEAEVEGQFSLDGDSAILDVRWVYDLRHTHHRLRNRFGHT
jgi:hypothetical protein